MGLLNQESNETDSKQHELAEPTDVEQSEEASGKEIVQGIGEADAGEKYRDLMDVTPEADALAKAGTDLLYAEEMRDNNLEMLKAMKPFQSIAKLTVTLIKTVDIKSGGKVPEEAVVPASFLLLDEVKEFASTAGVVIEQKLEASLAGAVIHNLIEIYEVPEQEIQQIMQDPEMQALIGGRG